MYGVVSGDVSVIVSVADAMAEKGLVRLCAQHAQIILGVKREPVSRRFGSTDDAGWSRMWKGMPSYDADPSSGAYAKFRLFARDASILEKMLGLQQRICATSHITPGCWFPPRPRRKFNHLAFVSRHMLMPRYPIYVVSKGRHRSAFTVKELDYMRVPFYVVVEPQEYEEYCKAVGRERVLKLPFSNLGQGSVPARNWVWDHALQQGHARHWVLDDNMRFKRRDRNVRINCKSANVFCAAEDFVDRYSNVGLAGFQYNQFVPDADHFPPFVLNRRVYSCVLVDTSLPFRWRGKYNEDTDLSLRVLKQGLCTVLFNCFLVRKPVTMTMAGGNTDEVYQRGKKRLEFAESLRRQHPDVVKVVTMFQRPHHKIDYTPFDNNHLSPLVGRKPKQHKTFPDYGMKLISITPPTRGLNTPHPHGAL